MTDEQAGALIDRLVAAFDKNLRPETAAVYLEFFTRQSYERAQAAVEKCIAAERFFPSIGTIQQRMDEETLEGHANASVYAKGNDPDAWSRTNEAAWMRYMYEQIRSLSESDYWSYLIDEAFREQKLREWATAWETGG